MTATRDDDDVQLASSPVRHSPTVVTNTSSLEPRVERRIGFPSATPVEAPVKPSVRSPRVRESETWELLDTADSSLIEMEIDTGDESAGSTKSWKTATNGKAMDDFNPSAKPYGELRTVGSIKSFASSIKRKASRTLSGSRYKDDGPSVVPGAPPIFLAHENELEEEEQEMLPGSPASAIGVVKRHSTMSLNHRPSTIRLVSPSAALVLEAIKSPSPDFSPAIDDDLPLTGQNSMELIKKRRSVQLQAGRSPRKSVRPSPRKSRVRASMPLSPVGSSSALATSASILNVYPSLPDVDHPMTPIKQVAASPEVPGSYPKNPTSPSFVFGAGNGTTSADFSDAGMKLLQEMQAKMGGAGSFNTELLKGKRAEVTKLVSVNQRVGSGSSSGGWGLSSSANAPKDRFAEIHQREFSKMQSISQLGDKARSTSVGSAKVKTDVPMTPGTKRKASNPEPIVSPGKRKLESNSASLSTTVNGLPAKAPEADGEARGAKRTKVSLVHKASTGLKYFNSLRGGSSTTARKDTTPNRMRSNLRGKESRPRFGFLSSKASVQSIDSTTSDDFVKISGPDETSTKGKAPQIPSVVATEPTPGTLRRATVVQANMQKSLSKRAPIPQFGPPVTKVPLKDADDDTVTRPALRKTSTPSTASLSRSHRSVELNRTASGDDLKGSFKSKGFPSTVREGAATARDTPPRSLSSRPSTLFAPTASSMARMQATVKPPGASATASPMPRPLPRPPKPSGIQITGPQIATTTPFGAANSRANHLFESNFHLPPKAGDKPSGLPKMTSSPSAASLLSPRKRPAAVTSSRPTISSPMRLGTLKSPARASLSAQRARDRASGVAGVKARNHDDAGVAQRRADIKAKHDRVREERELRSMLG